jgi:hypothetical protein
VSRIEEALSAADAANFVGREHELAIFGQWLETGPPLMHLCGPGGIGKSTLLRAFRRLAAADHRQVVVVDGASFEPDPEAFSAAASRWTETAPAEPGPVGAESGPTTATGRDRVLMVDGFEHLWQLTPFLQKEFLPSLPAETRVVLAGRYPLGLAWGEWADLMRTVGLSRWSRSQVGTYLARRGLSDPETREAVWQRTLGHPLAVSLATDVIGKVGLERMADRAEWHLSLRHIIEDLLADVADPGLRRLLEAASMLRQFDEEALAAVGGADDAASGFMKLCQLSVVRAGERGLSLHEEVRRLIGEDLKWRDPERYDRYRERARIYYQARAGRGPGRSAGRMLVDQLFLSDIGQLRDRIFLEDEPEGTWIQRSDPDGMSVAEVLDGWLSQMASSDTPPPPEELDPALWARMVDLGGGSVQLARAATGEPLSAGFLMPIVRQTVDALPPGPVRTLIDVWRDLTGAKVEYQRATASAWYLSTIATRNEPAAVTEPALIRACIDIALAQGGEYLVLTRSPVYHEVAQVFGFHPIWQADVDDSGVAPLVGYHVDLDSLGVVALLESLVAAVPPPRTFRGPALERQIETVLRDWRNPAALDRSPLAAWVAWRQGGEAAKRPGAAVRDLISGILRSAGERQDDERLALEAVIRGYLEPAPNQEAAARRLSVSRATYYRLRKRGVEVIARDVWQALAG